MKKEDIIVGLDIGTTKIAAVVGRLDEYGRLNIVGVGHSPSQGLRRGVVININQTVASIQKAIEEAELMAGQPITRVYAGIAGDHIRSINSTGVISITNEDKIVTEDDVERVLETARAIALPMDREVLHVLPQEYTVDTQPGIKDPVGMSCTRLEAEVHIVTAAAAAAHNIINCIRQAGYDVADIVLEPYASSLAVLEDDERALGVGIVDIGGGTTDIAIFFDGSIRYTSVIGLGGEHVTADISHGLHTSREQAEEIKKKHGVAFQGLLEEDELIRVPGVGGRKPREISRAVLSGIIQPRMSEMLALAMREMEKSNIVDYLGAGIVFTGGAAMLEGLEELAERELGMPVKIGKPHINGGLVESVDSPMYATGVGLLQYAILYRDQEMDDPDDKGIGWVMSRLRRFFEDLFN
ncbi:MAG TPA: cell division protein FtsA [Caldithrix abyssi]|uniref:Cell division protein FtsA n=1 Tax=Caldithrix abyssi TaxID=187145 RepID=A0A7V5RPT1_CALAY|nr:cell division protein FtsA [Caldithrix abyssi]